MEFLKAFIIAAGTMTVGMALILAWITAVHALGDQHPLWALALFFGVLILGGALVFAALNHG